MGPHDFCNSEINEVRDCLKILGNRLSEVSQWANEGVNVNNVL